MTDPTEAEVEAATKVIEDLLNRYGENVFDYAANIARAALTAAAQVRGPAVSLAHILTQARRVRNFSDPSQVFEAVPVRALGAETPHLPDLGPLPIYGATEAPSAGLAAAQAGEWQPIETAPKDGSEIVLGFAGTADMDFYSWSQFCADHSSNPARDGWADKSSDPPHDAPTHWLRINPPDTEPDYGPDVLGLRKGEE